ncbi:precorrin-2 dehydrogenase/sirohydrochlorin ferrochelatase family protein [Falsiroseomonas sp. HW251]|uniref:precorrin-2 dehydrogenase/sirohydrochlorin ferrochelatase family protein n=1 Tax=Falsiroseomonas sp. HW251 TaxID=3390998 RepID=UPI003D31E69E
MLPLVFLPDTPVLLAGRGGAFARRRALLEGAGLTRIAVHEGVPPEAALRRQRLVFGAGLEPEESEWLAAAARARGVTVNIEDVPHLCDVHVPALVRRGDLLLTVSTGGAAPALSAALRAWLQDSFGEEWAGRLAEVAALRARRRAAGDPPAEVIRAVRAHLDGTSWLQPRCLPAGDTATNH